MNVQLWFRRIVQCSFFMINGLVRIRNKQFRVYVIPALALVLPALADVFGRDFTSLIGKLIAGIDAVFALLVILGVANTTPLPASLIPGGRWEPWQDRTE